LIPVNIEHSKDRFGALVLIMLGETVLAVTLRFNELKQENVDARQANESYHLALIISILLTFMFALLYFHGEPMAASSKARDKKIKVSWLTLPLSHWISWPSCSDHWS
jgi:low temperature requirement protein LtrA